MSELLGTNVISESAKSRPEPSVVEWLRTLDDEEAFRSVIALGELRAGIEQLEPNRRRAGMSIGAVDALLAATAAVHRLSLATHNVRHFAATSIDVIDPWTSSQYG